MGWPFNRLYRKIERKAVPFSSVFCKVNEVFTRIPRSLVPLIFGILGKVRLAIGSLPFSLFRVFLVAAAIVVTMVLTFSFGVFESHRGSPLLDPLYSTDGVDFQATPPVIF